MIDIPFTKKGWINLLDYVIPECKCGQLPKHKILLKGLVKIHLYWNISLNLIKGYNKEEIREWIYKDRLRNGTNPV